MLADEGLEFTLQPHEYELWRTTMEMMLPLMSERELLAAADRFHDELRERRGRRFVPDLIIEARPD